MNLFSIKAKDLALVLFSVASILFGIAAIIYSSTPAQADVPASTYAAGKYQMAITSVINSSDVTSWYILVWDTETGRSKIYYGNPNMKKTQAAYGSYNLPSSPL